jgi:hypothetical protein
VTAATDREVAFGALYWRVAEIQAKPEVAAGLFAYTRHGVRAAIAAIEDETFELWGAWESTKRHMGSGIADIQHELLDVAACAMVCYLGSLQEPEAGSE